MVELYENDRKRFQEEYLSNAKEKAQFMSCILVIFIVHYLEGGDYSKCMLPVLFDATCSGMLHHLSALTTNLDLAALLTLQEVSLNTFMLTVPK